MLMMTNNLDRTDEAAISNWPFTYGSSLDTGDGVLTADSFLSVSVNVDHNVVLPCRFKGITSDGRLVICDSTGADVCSGQLYAASEQSDVCSFFLYDQYAILRGFICCKSDVCTRLFALSVYTNDMHYFGSNAFVLLPDCHIQTVHGTAKSFGVQGTYVTANLQIRFSSEIATPVIADGTTLMGHRSWNAVPEGGSAVCFGIYNIEVPADNTWCEIVVNGTTYNVEDKNLLIKAGFTSNLRVVTTDAAIILRGVLDVQ